MLIVAQTVLIIIAVIIIYLLPCFVHKFTEANNMAAHDKSVAKKEVLAILL